MTLWAGLSLWNKMHIENSTPDALRPAHRGGRFVFRLYAVYAFKIDNPVAKLLCQKSVVSDDDDTYFIFF